MSGRDWLTWALAGFGAGMTVSFLLFVRAALRDMPEDPGDEERGAE